MSHWLAKISELEPARVRAVIAAVVGLAASIGIVIDAELSGAIEAIVIGLLTLLPLLLGESIRRKVTPVAVLDEDEEDDVFVIEGSVDEDDYEEDFGEENEQPNKSGVPPEQWRQ